MSLYSMGMVKVIDNIVITGVPDHLPGCERGLLWHARAASLKEHVATAIFGSPSLVEGSRVGLGGGTLRLEGNRRGAEAPRLQSVHPL